MLPGMKGKPRVAIVGAGNFGSALAWSLKDAGYVIEAIIVRSRDTSRMKGTKLAKQVGGRAVGDLAGLNAELVWFCVPDGEIGRAAAALGRDPSPPAKSARRRGNAEPFDWKGKLALHSSGALGSDELSDLRRRGAAVASVHPMMTFVRGSRPSLAGVSFAIEGDVVAVRVARRVVRDVRGRAYSIRKKDKAAYHAWGTFASPLFTALLATTEQVAALAGVSRKEAKERMIPILQQTLANYVRFGVAGAFSGPIVRGDVDTAKRHLRVLRGRPAARAVYSELASSALLYMPVKNKKSLRRLLDAARD
ncbi:MAG: hypothetical protein DMG79_15225 [Acidobacteria bacterium]|nr:MAG: hypothetical protein DMG79_15225 [Acidobacteriota bacterium]